VASEWKALIIFSVDKCLAATKDYLMSDAFSKKERVDILESLLDRVDGWLKYAETKNGVLLTLVFATLGVGLRLGNGQEWCSGFAEWLWKLGLVLCFFAISILFSAFVPRLGKWYEFVRGKLEGEYVVPMEKRNFVFFGHLAGLSEKDVESNLSELVGLKPSELSRLERDLIRQVHANAGIAHKKFKVFAPAAYLFGFGLIVIVFSFVLF